MKPYRNILFDLDGTIVDPVEGITKSVAYALRHLGIEVPDTEALYPFIGPPLKDSFREFYNLSEEQAETAVQKYRERFSAKGIYENKVYDGIRTLLQQANSHGLRLFLATSKPTVFAQQILDYFDLSREFVFVGGSDLGGLRTAKADVIAHVLQQANIVDLQATVMVGDRKHDVLGAKLMGLDSIGVLYGYGNREELVAAGADYVAENVRKLGALLINQGV